MIRWLLLTTIGIALVTDEAHKRGKKVHANDQCAAHAEAFDSISKQDKADLLGRIKRREQFAVFLDDTIRELAEGRIGLHPACDHIHHYCLARYPCYFEHLQTVSRNNLLRVNIALRLVAAVSAYEPQDGMELDSDRLSRLKGELYDMVRQEQPGMSWNSFMAAANVQGICIR
jgi:hypothetical protein